MENVIEQDPFKSVKVVESYDAEISAPAEKVFPLLCPVREYEWISTWTCELVRTESGVAEDMCVFITDRPPFGRETWVCTRYECPDAIQYTRFSQNAIARLDIKCIEGTADKSTWRWTLTAVGLTDEGNRICESATEQTLQIFKTLNVLLEHFVTKGEMLKM